MNSNHIASHLYSACLLHGTCNLLAAPDNPCDVVSRVIPQTHATQAPVAVISRERVLDDFTVLFQSCLEPCQLFST